MSYFELYPDHELLRLSYCSKANFSHWAQARGIEIELARMMRPAGSRPEDLRLGGIFHCGNAYFLTVVEGRLPAVQRFYQRTQQDERHRDEHIIDLRPIEKRRLQAGRLRYAGLERKLIRMLHQHGQHAFNPYDFNADLIADFLELCKELDRPRPAPIAPQPRPYGLARWFGRLRSS
ncbi:MAG: hypothetical protein EA370_11780 [Wenzhouxiangella sp.]|nr:MAG: hypothetical protein EA370_11780 [Wenzhouxiangella sp.]